MQKSSKKSQNNKLSEKISFIIFGRFSLQNPQKCEIGHLIFTPHGITIDTQKLSENGPQSLQKTFLGHIH